MSGDGDVEGEILSDYVQRRAADGRPFSMAEVAAYGLD